MTILSIAIVVSLAYFPSFYALKERKVPARVRARYPKDYQGW